MHVPKGDSTYFENLAIHIPGEIWEQIFSNLPSRDLKSLSQACSHFQEITKPLLWNAPSFNILIAESNRLQLGHLRMLALLEPPIRILHSDQLIFADLRESDQWVFSEQVFREVIEVLSSIEFNLNSFIVSKAFDDGLELTIDLAQLLMQKVYHNAHS